MKPKRRPSPAGLSVFLVPPFCMLAFDDAWSVFKRIAFFRGTHFTGKPDSHQMSRRSRPGANKSAHICRFLQASRCECRCCSDSVGDSRSKHPAWKQVTLGQLNTCTWPKDCLHQNDLNWITKKKWWSSLIWVLRSCPKPRPWKGPPFCTRVSGPCRMMHFFYLANSCSGGDWSLRLTSCQKPN